MSTNWKPQIILVTSALVATLPALCQGSVREGTDNVLRAQNEMPASQKPFQTSAYQDLWKSTCENSPDIDFVIKKFSTTAQGKVRVDKWLEDMGRANSPQVCSPFGSIVPPSGSGTIDLKNAKKAVLNQSELIALFQMVREQKQTLDKAFGDFLSADEQRSRLGRTKLSEIAGPAAVDRLQKETENWPRMQDQVSPSTQN